jgi:hypothetical protein
MFEANLKIISELKLFVDLIVSDQRLLGFFSTKPNSFIRNRKLPFHHLVLLISRLCKKSISVELDQFFNELSEARSCSSSAFTQQRMKLDANFFYYWNEILVKSFYNYCSSEVKLWNGYRLVAADGSNLSLVNSPELKHYFGGQSNQHGQFIQAKTYYCYDVLNELVLHSDIKPYRYGEMQMACDFTDKIESDMLMIYDRYYCNFRIIALHSWQEKEVKFVIRGNENYSIIKNFLATEKMSVVINMPVTAAAIESMAKVGYKINKMTLLPVRLVRVQLEKTVEVLMTNLWEEEGFKNEEFKKLYAHRWGIETNIGIQKNIMQMEAFSGLSVLSIKQDFFATVFTCNLNSVLIKEAQKTVDKMTNRKHQARVNRNKSFGKLRANLVAMFIQSKPENILKELYEYFIRDPIPKRPNRSFPRIIKNKLTKSKHKTFMNYKPTF